MPNVSSALPSSMCSFSDVRRSHQNCVVEERKLRNAAFERTKVNAKEKEVKTGMKQLTSVLKSVVCPNEIEKSVNMSTKEKEKHIFF